MLKFYLAVLLIISGLSIVYASDEKLSTVKLGILNYTITAEIADTATTRMTGLMHRTHLPEDSGMLFVFPVAGMHCMWMKDTIISLSVAFLNEAGEIINFADMIPTTHTAHCAMRTAKYALEMNSGWFEQKKINAGDKVLGISNVDSK